MKRKKTIKVRQKRKEKRINNLKRNAYVMIDHWSQILTVLISLYIYKNKREREMKKKKRRKN